MSIKEQLIIDIIKLQNPQLIESLYLSFKKIINQNTTTSSQQVMQNEKIEEEDLSVWDDIIEDTYKERKQSAKLFHHKIDMLFL
jgi:hypothetical protein